jgi:DNA polymerase-3 subunit alpha (Gram-positive type)
MVKDSPKISEILQDFMKFIDGATLVAQNAEFDMSFLKRFASADDYKVTNKVMDTMILSRELFPTQKHHNLKTIAERFGITFHHHRALSDAYATAEAFIKMMKIKFNA